MINIEFYIPHPLHRVVGSRGTEGVCVGLLLFEEEVIMSVPNAVNCKPGKASRHTAKQININKKP